MNLFLNLLMGALVITVLILIILIIADGDKLSARAEACQSKGAHLVRVYGHGHVCLRAEEVK